MSKWRRVTHRCPCPVCGKDNWCAVSDDGNVVKCMRVHLGSFTEKEDTGGMAYYHNMKDDFVLPPVTVRKPKRSYHELYAIHLKAMENLHKAPMALEEGLARSLGMPRVALRSIGLGLLYKADLEHAGADSRDDFVWSMPMRNAKGLIVGFRLRTTGGFKFALSGGTDGIFRSRNLLSYKTMYVLEGPTDTAAALLMGYHAVGRPNNTGGTQEIVDFAVEQGTQNVMVVMDSDPETNPVARKQTLKGGNKLVFELTRMGICGKTYYINGAKDAREYWQAGYRKLNLTEAS